MAGLEQNESNAVAAQLVVGPDANRCLTAS